MIIKKLNISVLFFACLLCAKVLFSQEQLRPLSGIINLTVNHQNNKNNHQLKTTATTSVLSLPFFDDFSYAIKSNYPSQKNWIDSNVYVNTGFAIAPISIGVATFDGLNRRGYPYNISAPVNQSAPADVLTSQPINLQQEGAFVYSPADSVYLSFYYQAEGNGDAPEPNDSLCLDFFKPNQNKWVKVWGRKGYNPSATDTNFVFTMIAIKDTAYFDSLFQFRFRNNATLSGSLDHWHIDYVYLNKNRTYTDTVIEDEAFVYQASPLLKNYSVMPYRQYTSIEMATELTNFIRNNHTGTKNTRYEYSIYDKNNVLVHTYDGGNANVDPFFNNGYSTVSQHVKPPLAYVIPPLTDSTYFTTRHVIFSNPDLVRENDTIERKQILSNYYAYDDGSAEVGYYLNTFGAKTAVRFTLNEADTLKSVRIYFDPIVDGTAIQGSGFRIHVWADGGNGPSNTIVIYRDSLVYPQYIPGSHNLFPTYNLTSCLPLGIGTYYIGIQQQTNRALNIGFDKNTNRSNALYYDIGNGWQQSAIKGSIMINPVMGCYEPIVVGIKENTSENTFDVFPNPAQSSIKIKSSKNIDDYTEVVILSSMGQVVLSENFNVANPVSIENLSNGFYYVYLKNKLTTTTPQKLVISK